MIHQDSTFPLACLHLESGNSVRASVSQVSCAPLVSLNPASSTGVLLCSMLDVKGGRGVSAWWLLLSILQPTITAAQGGGNADDISDLIWADYHIRLLMSPGFSVHFLK